MLLQIVNRCLSSEITALAIGFRLRAFYDRGEKVGILATKIWFFVRLSSSRNFSFERA